MYFTLKPRFTPQSIKVLLQAVMFCRKCATFMRLGDVSRYQLKTLEGF